MSGKPTYEELEQRVNELEKRVSKTKQTEEALRESEERYRAIFEGAAEGILIADIRTKRFIYANPTICRMLEYTEEELKRMSVGDIHPQEELRNVIFEFEAQAQEKKILAANISCLRKDGTTIYADINTSKVFIDGRECNVGFFSDIAERKQAEEALWDSNEKLTALFQSSPMAIITLDPDGNVTFWNPAAEKMFGWKEKEAIGRFLPFVPEGKKSEHHALRNRVLSGEGFHNVEALRQKKDGSDIYISISTVPLKDSTGSISGIMSVIVDITERKQTEEALLESEEKYRSLFNSSRDAIMTLAPPTWLFTSGNPATVELFKGRDEAEFISLGPWQLSPERQPDGKPSAEKAKEMIETAMRNGSHFFEWTHCHSDGTPFPAEVLLTRMEQRGQVLLQATVRNITERKQVEEQRNKLIAELQKALSEVKTLRGFLPICSHCKKIRDDKGYWNQIESYIQDHSEAEFSHGICQKCAKKYYPDMDIYDDNGGVTED